MPAAVCSPHPRTQLCSLEEGHCLGSCQGKGQRREVATAGAELEAGGDWYLVALGPRLG